MKRLLILSGKGGTGKTTTAAAFARFSGARAVADCDVDAPNLHLILPPPGTPQISDFQGGEKARIDPQRCVACGRCLSRCRFGGIRKEAETYQVDPYACEGCGVCLLVCPAEAIRLLPDVAGEKALYTENGVFSTAVLKMGRGNSGKLVTEVKKAMLKHAPERELAILDGSPGIGCPVIASMSGVDLALVVAEPSMSGLSDLGRLWKTARACQTKLAVCVNKWDTSPELTEELLAFCQEEGIPFLGKIPYDKQASKAINAGRTLADTEGPARDALKEIYEKTILLLHEKE